MDGCLRDVAVDKKEVGGSQKRPEVGYFGAKGNNLKGEKRWIAQKQFNSCFSTIKFEGDGRRGSQIF